MASFQWLGLLAIALILASNVFNLVRGRADLRPSLFWMTSWVVAGVFLAKPELSIRCADALGIGRGADLVFYCNVLFSMFGFFILYLRERKHRQEVTMLVRELALASATRSTTSSDQPI